MTGRPGAADRPRPRPALSVVVPCRMAGAAGVAMRGALLRLCLAALDRQSAARESFEVVIVDDAGDTAVAEHLAAYAAEHPSIHPRVVRNEGAPLGVAGAYNLGVAEAAGELVLLSTDDSLLAPDTVAAHLRAQARRGYPSYVCGIEHQYLAGVLFRDIITGALHPPDDLAVRTFGGLLGFADIRYGAEMLGLTGWTVTPEDVRSRFAGVLDRTSLPPNFRDIYAELRSEREDLRWLCVRMGNHSIARGALLRIGGVDPDLPGANSDQDLGLKLVAAGIPIVLEPAALSVLVEHRRNVRAFADHSGLARLAQRWARPEVEYLHHYFSAGYRRSIADYRRLLAAVAAPPLSTVDTS